MGEAAFAATLDLGQVQAPLKSRDRPLTSSLALQHITDFSRQVLALIGFAEKR